MVEMMFIFQMNLVQMPNVLRSRIDINTNSDRIGDRYRSRSRSPIDQPFTSGSVSRRRGS